MIFFCRILIFILFFLCSFRIEAQELKNVNLQLQWKKTFEFSGFFIAKEKGYYKDAGLNVDILEWDYGVNIVDDVVNGKIQYGVARPSSIIDVSKGKDLIYLLAIYQSNPLVLLADKSSGIRTLKDLKNKKIMATKDHLVDASIVALFSSNGINIDELKIVKHSFDVKDLLGGKTDLMAAYISNEPFLLKEAGGKPVIFNSKDYGFDFYNDILVCSRKYLSENTEEVKKFRKATLKGFEYAFKNIDETVDLVYNKYNTLKKSKRALLFEANELKKLAYYKTNKIGSISYDKLEKIYNIYKLLGLAKSNLDVSKIVYRDISADMKITDKETMYLQNKGAINLCIDPDWMPFEKIDEHGEHIGISADYIKLFRRALSMRINLIKTSSWKESLDLARQGKCDIISSILKTPERSKYLNFTKPYIRYELVAVTKKDVFFVDGIKDLYGKKIGVATGDAFVEIAKIKYPEIKIVEVNDFDEGLFRVNSGELFAFVDSFPSVAYHFGQKKVRNLKISGKIEDSCSLCFGVKKDDTILLDILQKEIKNLSENKKQDILKRWISVKNETFINDSLINKILVVSLIIVTILFIWNRKINEKNRILKKSKKKIESNNKKLQALANTDRLTGLYNRLRLDNVLENEIIKSHKSLYKFGVCLLDIDHFKKVNDSYGHQTGDNVLKEMSAILKKFIRSSDYVGRWGGEEFLIICLGINGKDFFTLLEKIRSNIKNYNFAQINKITVSLGAAICKDNDSIESLLKRADDALYKAKNTGKDKVILSD